jgi:hypothetical protein
VKVDIKARVAVNGIKVNRVMALPSLDKYPDLLFQYYEKQEDNILG